MRPKTIVQYEGIYIASIVIGIIGGILQWPLIRAQIAMAPLSPATMQTVIIGSTIFGMAINLLLLWLTARRGNDVARILVGIFFVIGIASSVWSLAQGNAPGVVGVIRVITIVLEAIMFYLLFIPAESKAWFGRDRIAS